MRRLALIVLFLALPAAAAQEKWWDAYNRGVKAVNAKNYDAAIAALQKALAEMPNESNAARTRNEIITYVPHFWLGIARFSQDDFDGALREWKICEEQGAVARTEYYPRLRDFVSRAQAEKVRQAQNAASGARKDADAALSRALSGQMEALSAGGDRSETYRAANRKLQEAMSQFKAAGASIDAYKRSADTAAQARELFTKAADDARKQKASRPAVASRPVQAQVVPTTTVAVVPEPPKQQPPPSPAVVPAPVPTAPVESEAHVAARIALQQYRRRLASLPPSRSRELDAFVRSATRQANDLQEDLDAASDDAATRKIGDAISTAEADLTAKLITTASAAPKVAQTRPQLESAYRAFAAGDLDSSERVLSAILNSAPSGEAYLLRGCARYTRALLSRNAESLIADATMDFKTALKLNRGLRLDKKSFSPKLVAFFDQVRKTAL